MAGRITTVFDLDGRTLIPGIIEPHRHIYGNALRWADRVGLQFPPDGVTFVTAQADRDLEKTQAVIRGHPPGGRQECKHRGLDCTQYAALSGDPGNASILGHDPTPDQSSNP